MGREESTKGKAYRDIDEASSERKRQAIELGGEAEKWRFSSKDPVGAAFLKAAMSPAWSAIAERSSVYGEAEGNTFRGGHPADEARAEDLDSLRAIVEQQSKASKKP